MQTSRLPLPLTVVLLVLAAACSSPSNPSTTSGGSGGGNGTGMANGTGNGNASGKGPTGGSTSGANGGSASSGATGTGGEDPIGTQCSKTGNTDYMPCSTSADCMCPGLFCALDPVLGFDDAGGSICTHECKVTADCPDIFTSCQNGLCTTNVCEADGGGGAFMGPCDAMGQGDGTCEPSFDKSDQEIIGVCFQAGTVNLNGGRCDANQAAFSLASAGNKKRPAAGTLCPIGYQCVGGACMQLCDPVFEGESNNDAGGCLDDKTCLPIGSDTRFGGHCVVQGDGGCLASGGATELQGCGVDTPCDCPMECEIDFDSLRHVCEKTCKTTADCEIPITNCQRDGYCNFNYCVQTYYGQPAVPLPDAGRYTGPCNYAGIGDGICEPEYAQDMFGVYGPFGYCEPAGTQPVGGTCGNPPFCDQNEVCVGPMGGPFACQPFCQPFLDGGNGGCAKSTDGCFTVIYPTLEQAAGVCAACSPAGTGCYNSPECCDGYCAYAQADAGNGFCN